MAELQEVKEYSVDEVIFSQNQLAERVGVVLKGSVTVQYDHFSYVLKKGDLIGIGAIDSNRYKADYIAAEDCKVLLFHVQEEGHIYRLLELKEISKEEVVKSVIRQAALIGNIFDILTRSMDEVVTYIKNSYIKYLTFCKQTGKKPVLSRMIKDVSVSQWEIPNDYVRQYYQEMNEIDSTVLQSFLAGGENICYFHIKSAVSAFRQVNRVLEPVLEEYNNIMEILCSTEGDNIFTIYMGLLKTSESNSQNISFLTEQIRHTIAFTKRIEEQIKEDGAQVNGCVSQCEALFREIAELMKTQVSSCEDEEEQSPLVSEYGLDDCTNMLEKILAFSTLTREKKDEFAASVKKFKNMSDKKSADDGARKFRKKVSNEFYEVYENVLLRAEVDKVKGLVLDLFLNFGVVDETMFTTETLNQLINLKQIGEHTNAHVYTAREWLHAIYVGDKEPSRNDFDMDYFEDLKEQERKGVITKAEKTAYLTDQSRKVKFEIGCFIKQNSRLTNGELSTFCPILTEEEIGGSVEKMYVTVTKLTEAIDELLKYDYSLFHREKLYESLENKVTRMSINKQVFPDIILMPVQGEKARMWQEIEGRYRDSHARFTFPAFTRTPIEDLLLYAAGSFRWYMCRTIQGNYWNDISDKSLTSEYYDYIQFYKKNKELSEQAREKITLQLQRARNSFAECFVADYILWIKSETKGSIRLNKVAREILATYCPPLVQYREALQKQPMFAEAFARFERNRNKKIKEMNNRRVAIRNANGTETKEFIDEFAFYENN